MAEILKEINRVDLCSVIILHLWCFRLFLYEGIYVKIQEVSTVTDFCRLSLMGIANSNSTRTFN